ncbi:putative RDD family membrane protein YckC [Alkalibacillus flavidus]|uniref:RDD family membrane protein YckC n=1 Tax=Alkalibacillus flavidus TaxID=546021 RepID=A0ABV2KX07_9BACI
MLTTVIYGQFFLDDQLYNPLDFLSWLYFIIVPAVWMGYTLGKKAMDIRIARVDGEKVTIKTMLLRQVLANFIYLLTLGIGIIVSAFMVGIREDKRAMHDFIAGTYVTYESPYEYQSPEPKEELV